MRSCLLTTHLGGGIEDLGAPGQCDTVRAHQCVDPGGVAQLDVASA
jgi:hypothetical protein